MLRNLLLTFVGCLVAASSFAQWDSREWASDNFAPSTKVTFTQTNLPLVFIHVKGQTIHHGSKILAMMKIIDNGDGHNYRDTIAHANQKVDYEGYVSIKYRGNSSFYNSKKKPFAIRTLKAGGVASKGVSAKKEKVKIMGMAKDNDWALLAPWQDKSYMRDVLTMAMARGGHTFVPNMKYCEVIVDGIYYGIYIMSERATKGSGRLNLNDITPDDMSGEFHVEIDRDDEDYYYQSRYAPMKSDGTEIHGKKITYQYKEPDYEDFSDLPAHTEDAIQAAINAMEDAFASANYKDPATGYRQYIDVPSFIDHEIAVEVSNNIDGYRLSSPLYKYSNTHAAKLGDNAKWKTALWDFNIAYGNEGYYSPQANGIWRYTANDVMYHRDNQLIPFFWYKLMKDEAYVRQLKMRWMELRTTRYSEAFISSKLDSLQAVLIANGAVARDNQARSNHFEALSRQKEALYDYIKTRLAFIDTEWLVQNPGGDDMGGGGQQMTALPVNIKSGFNCDVICEDASDIMNTTTHDAEARNMGFDTAGFVYYAKGVGNGLSDGYACDEKGYLASSHARYRLNLSKVAVVNNGLVLKGASASNECAVNEGTLLFSSPIQSLKLYIAGLSANGDNTVSVTINYTDGTTDSGRIHFNNWDTPDSHAFKNHLRRMATTRVGWANINAGDIQGDADFQIIEQSVSTDASKSIGSVKFTRGTESGYPTILALAYVPVTTDIETPVGDASKTIVAVYSINGVKRRDLQKGLNIVRYSDGSIRKVMGR